jgi:hypothetical protein
VGCADAQTLMSANDFSQLAAAQVTWILPGYGPEEL